MHQRDQRIAQQAARTPDAQVRLASLRDSKLPSLGKSNNRTSTAAVHKQGPGKVPRMLQQNVGFVAFPGSPAIRIKGHLESRQSDSP